MLSNYFPRIKKVSVRVTLHKGLKFRNADVGDGANTLDKDIGNVR